MKKLLLLLLGLTLALGASAGVESLQHVKQHGWHHKAAKQAPMTKLRGDGPVVIDEQPEGTLVSYEYSSSYFDFDDQVIYHGHSGASMVYAPDGETVYLQFYNGACWIEATLDGNKIHMPLGQYTYYNEDDETGDIYAWGRIAQAPNGGQGLQFVRDYSVNEVTFTITEDAIIMDNSDGGVNGLGAVGLAEMADDGSYIYYMEWDAAFTPLSEPDPGALIIHDRPEGEAKLYQHSGYYMYNYSDWGVENLGELVEIVYAFDGETVYVRNPVGGYDDDDSWVKGTIQGNTITVPLGQYVYWDSYGGYGQKLAWGKLVNGEFVLDEDVTEFTYTIQDDILTLDNTYGDDQGLNAAGLGTIYSHNNDFNLLEWNTVLTYIPNLIVDVPVGLEVEHYIRTGYLLRPGEELDLRENIGATDVAIDYESRTVYIRDYNEKKNYHSGWLKGTLSDDGTKIIVPAGQVILYDDYDGQTQRLYWGTSSLVFTEEDGYRIEFTPDYSVEEFTFTLHDNGCISLDNTTEPDYAQYIKYINEYYYDEIDWETYLELTLPMGNQTGLCAQDEYGEETYYQTLYCGTKYAAPHAAVPVNPVITEWHDGSTEEGSSYLDLEISHVDVDGFALEEENFSYTIYTDNDQPFTFLVSEYYLGGEDQTEVPYSWWMENWLLNPSQIFFFRTNAEGYDRFFNWRIGVQLHYTVDGVKNSSDIVYIEVFEHNEEPENPGDVTGDGIINVEDVTTLIDYLLGATSGSFTEGNADVNGNGIINVEDVTSLIDLLLGGN